MIIPETEIELAKLIKGTTAPFHIQGGGTRPIGQPVNATPLSTVALSGITLYEPGALTLVAGAGTPLADIDATLDAEGQRLAFEPMDHRGLLGTSGASTIGGVFAANVSGSRRIQAGAARDHLLGVRFVDGQGRIISNGGRVMKNVTGYDLVKLMAGSFGTLGVITEVSLKVLPKSQYTGVLLLEGLSDADAIRALSLALGSPYEITGAAHLQRGIDGAPVTMIRTEGSESSVVYRTARLQELLATFGTFVLETDPKRTLAGWKWVRDVTPYHDRPGDVWQLSVKPTDAPAIVASLGGAEALYDWGGGLVWLLVPDGAGLNAEIIRQSVAQHGGHATRIRGSGPSEAFQPLAPAVGALHEGLRLKFDPRQIFNPGLMRQAA